VTKFVKYLLIVFQVIGVSAAGLLLKDYNQLSMSALILLALFIISIFGGMVVAVIKSR
jgi:hypothetical protein